MTKLKQKILASLNNDAQLKRTLSDLPGYQQNLLKNHSNDMLNKTEKNRILKAYTDLSEINDSLNRYNHLKQGNYLDEAQEQKEEISDIMLKGGVSNYKYIWHSEQGEHTCEKCKALDGTVYELWDEIPEQPHPNCKCFIEEVEIPNEDSENNTQCNCIEDYISKIDTIINNALQLKSYISNILDSLKPIINELPSSSIAYYTIKVDLDGFEQLFGAVDDFIRNYREMRNANTIGADKYFHSKANCDAAKRGILGAIVATAISDLRELADTFKNTLIKHMTLIDSLKDSTEDQEANWYGRIQGIIHPNIDSNILIDKYRPNGLPDKY